MDFQIKGHKISTVEVKYLRELGLKWCSCCKQAKEFDTFSLNSKLVDGHNAICKDCSKNKRLENLERYKQRDAKRYQNKREELIKKAAEYRATHQSEIKELRDKYYQENKEIIIAKNSEYRETNLDKVKATQKEYHIKNRVARNNSTRDYRKANKDKLAEYIRNRYNNDNIYKLRCVCRQMVRRMFKSTGIKKSHKTQEVLGYTPIELKQHIEKQFKPGMTWDNYGDWHIDHIIPISSARTLEEGINLSRLENLQPLWAMENILKGNKLGEDLNL